MKIPLLQFYHKCACTTWFLLKQKVDLERKLSSLWFPCANILALISESKLKLSLCKYTARNKRKWQRCNSVVTLGIPTTFTSLSFPSQRPLYIPNSHVLQMHGRNFKSWPRKHFDRGEIFLFVATFGYLLWKYTWENKKNLAQSPFVVTLGIPTTHPCLSFSSYGLTATQLQNVLVILEVGWMNIDFSSHVVQNFRGRFAYIH